MYPIFPEIPVSPTFEEKYRDLETPALTAEEFAFFDKWMLDFHQDDLTYVKNTPGAHAAFIINCSDDDPTEEYQYLSQFAISPEVLLKYIESYVEYLDLKFTACKLTGRNEYLKTCFCYKVVIWS